MVVSVGTLDLRSRLGLRCYFVNSEPGEENRQIERIFEWAWKCGLDVTLTSRSYAVPYAEEMRLKPREDCNFTVYNRCSAEQPVLIFRSPDRRQEITAANWATMCEILKKVHGNIWRDLGCPELKL